MASLAFATFRLGLVDNYSVLRTPKGDWTGKTRTRLVKRGLDVISLT